MQFDNTDKQTDNILAKLHMGCGQEVRQRTLTPRFVGSNPPTPV